VLQAWTDIDPAMIIKAFKKCSISNALDRSEVLYFMKTRARVTLTKTLLLI